MERKRGILSVALVGLTSLAMAQVAIDNGPFVTQTNGGPGNAARSTLQNATLLMNTYGFGCQKVNGNRVADDFTVPTGARLNVLGLRAFAYQTTATAPTINDLNLRIWNAAPNAGGSVIFGDPVTNRFNAIVSTTTYRVDDLAGGATLASRLIFDVRANLGGSLVLNPGTYWADWQMGGTLPSGPWQVPVTTLGQGGKAGANGLQFLGGATNAWQAANDSGNLVRQDMAFQVIGTWLMAPASVITVTGTPFGGNLASLSASDNNKFVTLLDENVPNSRIDVSATSPSLTASSLTVRVEMSGSRTDLSQFIEAQNTANAWEQLDFSISSATDILRTVTVSTNPARFIRSGGQLNLRVVTIPSQDIDAGDGWTHSIDWIQWEVSP